MKHIKKNINLYIKIIIVAIFSILIFNINECLMVADDAVYSKVFHDFATFKTWAYEFYNIWSGRIITSALSNLFLRMPLIIFKICNTLVYIMAIIAIYKIIKYFIKTNNQIIDNLIFLSIFIISFLIDRNVISAGVVWVTGSFNYLWPTAFMLVAIIPFIKVLTDEKDRNIFFVIYILADLVACFAEQTALVLLTIGTIAIGYLLFNKKRVNKLLLIHYIFIIILTIIEISAPGNFVRFTASTLRRYPTFDMLSIGDKFLQGIILLGNQLINYDNILMIILTLAIMIGCFKKKDFNKFTKIISLIPFLYFTSSFICSKLGVADGILYNFKLFGIDYIYGVTIYIPILIFIVNLVLIISLMLFVFDDYKTGILTTLIFLGGLASTLTISFSPTIYASGSRVFLLMDFLFMIVIGILLKFVLRF